MRIEVMEPERMTEMIYHTSGRHKITFHTITVIRFLDFLGNSYLSAGNLPCSTK